MSDEKHAYSDTGYDIIHAYIQLLHTQLHQSVGDSYSEITKERKIGWAPIDWSSLHRLTCYTRDAYPSLIIWPVPSRVVMQRTRRRGATTCAKYTVIYPIQNILSIY